jgi:hypothetical protein
MNMERLAFPLGLVLVLLAAAMLVGCCTTNPGEDPIGAAFNRNESIIRLAVNVGVGQVLTAHPEWAAPAAEIADAVAVELESEGLVSLDRLQTEVTGRIHWDRLDAAEQSLILSVVDSAADAIARRLDDSGIVDPSERKVRVAKILHWIAEAARARSGTQVLSLGDRHFIWRC